MLPDQPLNQNHPFPACLIVVARHFEYFIVVAFLGIVAFVTASHNLSDALRHLENTGLGVIEERRVFIITQIDTVLHLGGSRDLIDVAATESTQTSLIHIYIFMDDTVTDSSVLPALLTDLYQWLIQLHPEIRLIPVVFGMFVLHISDFEHWFHVLNAGNRDSKQWSFGLLVGEALQKSGTQTQPSVDKRFRILLRLAVHFRVKEEEGLGEGWVEIAELDLFGYFCFEKLDEFQFFLKFNLGDLLT